MLTMNKDQNGQIIPFLDSVEQPGQSIDNILEERRRLSSGSMSLGYEGGQHPYFPTYEVVLTCAKACH